MSEFIHFKLGDYFREGSHKTAISLPELVRQTNPFSVKNRPGCQPTLTGSKPKELFLAYNVKCNLPDSNPNGHDVKVQFDLSQVTDETTAKNLDVAVNCSCPAFLYWGGQWNSHQRDALTGEPRPLLTAPTERLDLRDGFVICKHLKAVSERILPAVQYNIVKILRQREVDKHKEQERAHPKPRTDREQRLEQRQREMKEREEKRKQRQKKDRNVRKQLEEGIKNRDVVKRDTPATPEERKRVPVLPPEKVPAPTVPGATPVMDLDEELGLKPAPAAPPEPPVEKPKPQKMPRPQEEDRDTLKELMREDQRRKDREVEQKLKNNPGKRR